MPRTDFLGKYFYLKKSNFELSPNPKGEIFFNTFLITVVFFFCSLIFQFFKKRKKITANRKKNVTLIEF